MRGVVALALAAVALGLLTGSSGAAPPAVAGDVELLLERLEEIHPDPYHATSRAEFRAAADAVIARVPALRDDEVLVELLRLIALLGPGDGHAGIQPLSTEHARPLHLYPLVLHKFSDGTHVVAATRRDLVGARLVGVGGRTVEEVSALVSPLVTYDNEISRRLGVLRHLVVAEVLHGLGVTATASSATFAFELPSGERREAVLAPLAAARYARAFPREYSTFVYALPQRARPLSVSHRRQSQWFTTLDRGRVVYVSYTTVLGSSRGLARRVQKYAARRKIRRIVVDVRNNPGGDNRNSLPLLSALASKHVNRRGRLVLIVGGPTFSAAAHFASDVQRLTRAVLVGEPTGGAVNHYSDTASQTLPATGWVVGIPQVRYDKRPGETGLSVEPDVRVPLSAREFFAGRDPALRRALALPG